MSGKELCDCVARGWVDGWHSGLKRYFDKSILSFYKFLTQLRSQAAQVSNKVSARIQGAALPRGNAKYVANNKKVMSLMSEFHVRTPNDYLSFLAYSTPDMQQ